MYSKVTGHAHSVTKSLVTISCIAFLLVSCLTQTPIVPSSTPASTSTTHPDPVIQPTPVAISTTQVSQPSSPIETPVQTAPSLPVALGGLESHDVQPAKLDQFNEIGARIVRRNGLLWSQVESVQGERNWASMAELEDGLQLLGSHGFQTILIVRGTPDWAQKVPGYTCGQIKRKYLADFGSFLHDAVARYSVPPYNVKYWELWNEPDVDPALISPQDPFGCWGDQADEYYGGEYYAQMLKQVYPAIKDADPQAQVLIGGLLLDCDPTHPPEGKDCKPSRFLEGILQGGGVNFFDIVSFHGYALYNGSLEMDEQNPAWAPRGGIVVGKANFIHEVLASYGVDKPVMDTESALLCPEWEQGLCNPPGNPFFEAQADYGVILYVRNWAEGIAGTIWYQFEGPGWRYSGLVDEKGATKPVYRAMAFLNHELNGARYSGLVEGYPSVRGYAFVTPQKRVWVFWSPDSQPHSIVLPDGVTSVYDKYGNLISSQGNSLEVMSPVYVELAP